MVDRFSKIKENQTSLSSDWKQDLQSWISSILFALCLLYFLFRLGGQEDLFMLPHLLPLAILCLFFGIVFNKLKVFFTVSIAFIVIIILQIILKVDIRLPFLSISFWHNFGANFQKCLAWLILPEDMQIVKPGFFDSYAYVLLSMVSVLTIWFLPIPLLNMFFLITPLFFIENLTSHPLWIFYLLLGLFFVYSSYAFRQDPSHRDQRAPISFGLILIALTFVIQLIVPPTAFYNKSLSRTLNDLRPIEGGNITSFSLKELGFYPQGSMRIGGPVEPNEKTYLKINAGPESFYLRGAAYDAFDGKSWSLATPQTLERFSWDDDYFNDFKSQESKIFWFPSAEDRDIALNNGLIRPSFHQTISMNDMRNVFHGGRPGHFIRLTEPLDKDAALSDAIHNPSNTSSFMYSNNGMVVADKSYNDYGVITEDYIVPVEAVLKQNASELFIPKRGRGERALEKTVRAKDPKLAEILYDKDLPFHQLIRQMSIHFMEDYEYTLDPPPIPESENFIDNFLTNKKGYCVYFASSWSILLRDIGYETRYAEGFIVPSASGDANSLSLRKLNGKQAHAWCEINMEGLGWYPLEACPTDHLAELSGYTPGSNQKGQSELPPAEETENSEEIPENSSEEEMDENRSSESSEEPLDKDDTSNKPLEPQESLISPSEASEEQEASNNHIFAIIVLILLLIFLIFSAFKKKRWNDRQKEEKLSPTEESWKKTLKRILNEIERLAEEDGAGINNQDSAGIALNKVIVHYGLDQEDWTETVQRLEQVLYKPDEVDQALVKKLHYIYKLASAKKKETSNFFKWWKEEVYHVPAKPW